MSYSIGNSCLQHTTSTSDNSSDNEENDIFYTPIYNNSYNKKNSMTKNFILSYVTKIQNEDNEHINSHCSSIISYKEKNTIPCKNNVERKKECKLHTNELKINTDIGKVSRKYGTYNPRISPTVANIDLNIEQYHKQFLKEVINEYNEAFYVNDIHSVYSLESECSEYSDEN